MEEEVEEEGAGRWLQPQEARRRCWAVENVPSTPLTSRAIPSVSNKATTESGQTTSTDFSHRAQPSGVASRVCRAITHGVGISTYAIVVLFAAKTSCPPMAILPPNAINAHLPRKTSGRRSPNLSTNEVASAPKLFVMYRQFCRNLKRQRQTGHHRFSLQFSTTSSIKLLLKKLTSRTSLKIM